MKKVFLIALIILISAIGCTTTRGTTNLDTLQLTDDLIVGNDGTIGNDLTVAGDFVLAGGITANSATITNTLTVGGTMTGTNAVFTGTLTAEQLTSTDDALVTDLLTVGGDITITGDISNVEHIQFDLTTINDHGEGTLHWNSDDGTLEVGMPGGDVKLQVGQETIMLAKARGSDIPNGSVIYVSGASGNRPEVRLALADNIATSRTTVGVATEDISNNQNGYVTLTGIVRDIDTDGFPEGSLLYLSPTVAGAFTTTQPIAPDLSVVIGVVLFESQTEGTIIVRPVFVQRLAALSDVDDADLLAGKVPVWNEAGTNFVFASSITLTETSLQTTGAITYTDTFWDDVRVPLATTRVNPATSKPDYGTFIGGTKAFLFDDATTETVTFAAQMPHGWKLGTAIDPHVHWSPITTNGGTVVFSLECTIADINGTFGATSTISTTATADGTAFKHQYVDLGDINMSSHDTVSTMLQCALSRLGGSDTHVGDVAVHEIDFHFEVDAPGSKEETAK